MDIAANAAVELLILCLEVTWIVRRGILDLIVFVIVAGLGVKRRGWPTL